MKNNFRFPFLTVLCALCALNSMIIPRKFHQFHVIRTRSFALFAHRSLKFQLVMPFNMCARELRISACMYVCVGVIAKLNKRLKGWWTRSSTPSFIRELLKKKDMECGMVIIFFNYRNADEQDKEAGMKKVKIKFKLYAHCKKKQ